MGLNFLGSSSSLDKKSVSMFSKWLSTTSVGKEIASNAIEKNKKLPNPDPKNYIIRKHFEQNGFLMILINFPDCINYEGDKILVFSKCTLDDLKKQKFIDPHFSDNKKFFSPMARFEPTHQGWIFGKEFIKLFNIKK